ncbi:MAG: DUF2281 domain-containing protein [Cyanobacteria bacterium J06648_16]
MTPIAEQISRSVNMLPEIYQREVLDFIEFLRAKHQKTDTEVDQPTVSFFDVAQDVIGTAEGPGDLSTNPEYMRDYGQ